MNRQEARKIVFDTLNNEMDRPNNGTDTMAWSIVEALGFTDEPERVNLSGFQIIGDMEREELIAVRMDATVSETPIYDQLVSELQMDPTKFPNRKYETTKQ